MYGTNICISVSCCWGQSSDLLNALLEWKEGWGSCLRWCISGVGVGYKTALLYLSATSLHPATSVLVFPAFQKEEGNRKCRREKNGGLDCLCETVQATALLYYTSSPSSSFWNAESVGGGWNIDCLALPPNQEQLKRRRKKDKGEEEEGGEE